MAILLHNKKTHVKIPILLHTKQMLYSIFASSVCEVQQNTKFGFFQNFQFKLYFWLLNINFAFKMSSFEVHYNDVANKAKFEGAEKAKNCYFSFALSVLFLS